MEQFVGVVAWAARKLKRFTTTAQQVIVVCPEEEWPLLVTSEEIHLKVRALIVELTLYNCKWVAGDNPWVLGGAMVEIPEEADGAVDVEGAPISWAHLDTTLKMPSAVLVELPLLTD